MQRVGLHARPSIIQVGCPTCCYQVCALNHAKVGDADLNYPSEPCHRNANFNIFTEPKPVITLSYSLSSFSPGHLIKNYALSGAQFVSATSGWEIAGNCRCHFSSKLAWTTDCHVIPASPSSSSNFELLDWQMLHQLQGRFSRTIRFQVIPDHWISGSIDTVNCHGFRETWSREDHSMRCCGTVWFRHSFKTYIGNRHLILK